MLDIRNSLVLSIVCPLIFFTNLFFSLLYIFENIIKSLLSFHSFWKKMTPMYGHEHDWRDLIVDMRIWCKKNCTVNVINSIKKLERISCFKSLLLWTRVANILKHCNANDCTGNYTDIITSMMKWSISLKYGYRYVQCTIRHAFLQSEITERDYLICIPFWGRICLPLITMVFLSLSNFMVWDLFRRLRNCSIVPWHLSPVLPLNYVLKCMIWRLLTHSYFVSFDPSFSELGPVFWCGSSLTYSFYS